MSQSPPSLSVSIRGRIDLIRRSVSDTRILLEHAPGSSARSELLVRADDLERRVADWEKTEPDRMTVARALDDALALSIDASKLRRTT